MKNAVYPLLLSFPVFIQPFSLPFTVSVTISALVKETEARPRHYSPLQHLLVKECIFLRFFNKISNIPALHFCGRILSISWIFFIQYFSIESVVSKLSKLLSILIFPLNIQTIENISDNLKFQNRNTWFFSHVFQQ